MSRNFRFLLALVGQAPLLANFIRAAAPKTPLKFRILLLYLRFFASHPLVGGVGVFFALGILEFFVMRSPEGVGG